MNKPTIDQMRVAADWLGMNDGDESPDCQAVAKWLNTVAAKAELDAEIRAFAKRENLTIPRDCFAAVRSALVKKFAP